MKMKPNVLINRNVTTWLLLIVFFLFPATGSAALANKNAIINQSDATYNGVTATEIQQYLNSTGTQLASYTIPMDFDVYYPIAQGQWDKITVRQEWNSEIYYGKTVAQLVAEWSINNLPSRSPASPGQINPLVPLATIDKESASITGSYKSNIVSERPITMSWLMGYGFDGKMDSCIKNGICDIEYNKQRAQWYGGPGQQIAEGTSALKRWSTNPTRLNSCTDQWQNMRIDSECLSIENSITYALYRYTPNKSGNELFYNLYTKIKAAFPFPNIVTTPGVQGTNDTNKYSLVTYNGSITLVGTKRSDTKVYFNNGLVSDTGTTDWTLKFSPEIGNKIYAVEYKNSEGTLIDQKSIEIKRHKEGDVNGDNSVDLSDLSLIATYWEHTDPANAMADLNGDDVVSLEDLSKFASLWEN